MACNVMNSPAIRQDVLKIAKDHVCLNSCHKQFDFTRRAKHEPSSSISSWTSSRKQLHLTSNWAVGKLPNFHYDV